MLFLSLKWLIAWLLQSGDKQEDLISSAIEMKSLAQQVPTLGL